MEKIKFSDPRTIKTIELPSFKGSKVEVYSGLTVGDQRGILEKYPNSKNDQHQAFASSIEMIFLCIKSWNFTDENENDLPISTDILNKFPQEDLIMLLETITGKKMNLNADNFDVLETEKKS